MKLPPREVPLACRNYVLLTHKVKCTAQTGLHPSQHARFSKNISFSQGLLHSAVASVLCQVWFNSYACAVQSVSATALTCITGARVDGIKAPSLDVRVAGRGWALANSTVRFRYLDKWSPPNPCYPDETTDRRRSSRCKSGRILSGDSGTELASFLRPGGSRVPCVASVASLLSGLLLCVQ